MKSIFEKDDCTALQFISVVVAFLGGAVGVILSLIMFTKIALITLGILGGAFLIYAIFYTILEAKLYFENQRNKENKPNE